MRRIATILAVALAAVALLAAPVSAGDLGETRSVMGITATLTSVIRQDAYFTIENRTDWEIEVLGVYAALCLPSGDVLALSQGFIGGSVPVLATVRIRARLVPALPLRARLGWVALACAWHDQIIVVGVWVLEDASVGRVP